MIADLEKPTGGSISVNGMTPEEARLQRAYGYVFQAASLLPWRTIEKNIALPLEIMGISSGEQKERIERVLSLVDLANFGKKYPNNCTLTNRMRGYKQTNKTNKHGWA